MLLPNFQPFIWNITEFKKHTESVCNNIGIYEGRQFNLYYIKNKDDINWATILASFSSEELQCLIGPLENMINAFTILEFLRESK